MTTNTPGWQPPHCPNPDCQFHQQVTPAWRFKRKGYFSRRCTPTRIQRFTCLYCGRNFSTQTFSTSYWQKRPELMSRLFMLLVGSMCNRQAARADRVAPATIQHQASRLGRHCLLFHAKQIQQLGPTPEVVVDGFETFEWSQYFPFHHNVAVDPETGYFLYHTDSPLRRKGRPNNRSSAGPNLKRPWAARTRRPSARAWRSCSRW